MRHPSGVMPPASFAFLVVPLLLASTAFAELPAFVRPAPTPDAHALPAPFGKRAVPVPRARSAAGENDGTWQEFGLLQVSRQLSSYDAAHDELLSLGGLRFTNWKLPLSGSLTWQPLPASASPAFIRAEVATVDPETGLVYWGEVSTSTLEIEVLDPRTGVTTPIVAGGTAPSIYAPALAFDPLLHRMLVYGGFDLASFGYLDPSTRVFALDLLPAPAWSELLPSGTPPPEMYFPFTVFDPVRRYLLIPDESQAGVHEISALTLDGPPQWLHFPTNGLPVGVNASPFVFDAASDRVVTVDGNGAVQTFSPDPSAVTWAWTQLPTSGVGPSARPGAGLTVDGTRHRLLVSGGSTPARDDTHADTWALSLDGPATWAQLTLDPVRPPIRGGASDGLDVSRDRLVEFGGSDEVGGFRNDTWALALGPVPTWSQITTQGDAPPPRYWHASAWDPTRDQLVVYGGYTGDGQHPLGDLWTLSFQVDPPRWTQISPPGPGPSNRFLSTLLHDPARDRFLLMFGYDGTLPSREVWELKLAPAPTWRLLAPGGAAPPARSAAMAAYDPARDRVIAFGGSDSFDDLWELDLGVGADGVWLPMGTPTHPSGRNLGLMRFDTVRNRMLLFGGYGEQTQSDGSLLITWLGDTWALDLSGTPTWQELQPAGFLPPPRDRANGAYDSLHDRLLLTCGAIDGSNDTWALTFGDVPTPTLLALARRDVTVDRVRLTWSGAAPGEHVTAYRRARLGAWTSLGELSADGRGFVTLEDHDVTPGARLEYRLGVNGRSGESYMGTTSVDVPQRALAVAARAADGRVALTVELPTGEPASVAVYDLAGRRVWSRNVGQLGAGTHELSTDGSALPSALYFVRVTQGHAVSSARVAMTR